MGGWRNTMWVRKNWLLWRFQKKLKLHPTPNSWNLLSCRRKNMLEYCQGRGSHLGSLFRIHPWGQATQSGQQCEPARTMEEEEKDSSALPVGRSRSVCGVCAEAHSKPGMAHGAVLGATSCSQGCFGKTSSQQAQPLNAPSGAGGKLEDMQHPNHLPNRQKEESCTRCDGQPTEGRSCDCPDPFGVFFRALRGFSFEDIHSNVYIFCQLMFLLMIIHSSSRVTSARPLGPWSLPSGAVPALGGSFMALGELSSLL